MPLCSPHDGWDSLSPHGHPPSPRTFCFPEILTARRLLPRRYSSISEMRLYNSNALDSVRFWGILHDAFPWIPLSTLWYPTAPSASHCHDDYGCLEVRRKNAFGLARYLLLVEEELQRPQHSTTYEWGNVVTTEEQELIKIPFLIPFTMAITFRCSNNFRKKENHSNWIGGLYVLKFLNARCARKENDIPFDNVFTVKKTK